MYRIHFFLLRLLIIFNFFFSTLHAMDGSAAPDGLLPPKTLLAPPSGIASEAPIPEEPTTVLVRMLTDIRHLSNPELKTTNKPQLLMLIKIQLMALIFITLLIKHPAEIEPFMPGRDARKSHKYNNHKIFHAFLQLLDSEEVAFGVLVACAGMIANRLEHFSAHLNPIIPIDEIVTVIQELKAVLLRSIREDITDIGYVRSSFPEEYYAVMLTSDSLTRLDMTTDRDCKEFKELDSNHPALLGYLLLLNTKYLQKLFPLVIALPPTRIIELYRLNFWPPYGYRENELYNKFFNQALLIINPFYREGATIPNPFYDSRFDPPAQARIPMPQFLPQKDFCPNKAFFDFYQIAHDFFTKLEWL